MSAQDLLSIINNSELAALIQDLGLELDFSQSSEE